jgi:GntR family transcriptional regulator of arabinose operon
MRELEINIPEDVSIVGYDDSSLAEATEVKLTSIKHPKMDMGIEAAKWIIDTVEGNNNNSQPIIYEPELIIRNSTASLNTFV